MFTHTNEANIKGTTQILSKSTQTNNTKSISGKIAEKKIPKTT